MGNILVWQWGRYGAGPRFALNLAEALQTLPGWNVLLCLSERAEILRCGTPPVPVWPVATYGGWRGLLKRLVCSVFFIGSLKGSVSAWRPDFAVCAMTSPLDLFMALALRWLRIPCVVIVHDAAAHPGDDVPLQHWLQRILLHLTDVPVALSRHVARQLQAQGLLRGRRVVMASHPPFDYFSRGACCQAKAQEEMRAPGPVRFLMFGRLLAYKGLDLLADALGLLPDGAAYECRVVGRGPDSPELCRLAAMPHVTVENRWVPEEEMPALIRWADVMLLPYREASQSGVGAIALSAGRWIVSTDVGGLREQFSGQAQALLCEPDAAQFAACLETLIGWQPLELRKPGDPGADEWKRMAAQLVTDIEAALRR